MASTILASCCRCMNRVLNWRPDNAADFLSIYPADTRNGRRVTPKRVVTGCSPPVDMSGQAVPDQRQPAEDKPGNSAH